MRTKGKKDIRQRILYLLFACCFTTLLIVGAATFFGMMMMKNEAEKVGVKIGETAAEQSNSAVKDATLIGLQKLDQERSDRIDERLVDLMWDATVLSKEMTRIFQNPQDYKFRPIYAPSAKNAGILSVQLRYLPGANPADLTEEIGLAGNLKDLQYLLFTESPGISSVYYTSESGFTVDLDRDAGLRAGEKTTSYDSRQRPWYRQAVAENKTILTSIYTDIQGRGLVLTAAAPYYNSASEIMGVVAVDGNMSKINTIVKQTTFGKTGYAFVLNNETGQVLFSPKSYEGTLSIDYNNNLEDDPVLFDNDDEKLAAAARKMAAGESGIDLVNFDGKSYYLAYTPIKSANWSFGAVMEEEEVTMSAELSKKIIADNTASFVESLNSTSTIVMIARGLAFILMIILIPPVARRLADKFTEPILALTNGVQEIAQGNFNKKLEIHAEKELEDLERVEKHEKEKTQVNFLIQCVR